jgi:HEAT repeats
MNRARGLSTAALAVTSFGLLVGLSGCPDNPYSVDTWIDKLDDSHEVERAVTEIEHLGDPKAIPALGKAWENQGCPQRILQVMIDLSRPLTPEEADKASLVDLAKEGRKASWDKAQPFLAEAIRPVDPNQPAKCGLDDTSPRSMENAGKAADALGDAQNDQALQALVDGLGQKYGPKAQAVKLSVILALGHYKDGRAVKALTDVLRQSPESQPLPIIAAAVNALSDIKSPEALPVLIETMYRVPPVFSQIQRALVASGPTVGGEMRKILRGEHEAVNKLFADNKLGEYCGDKDPSSGKIEKPVTPCKPISMKEFYAAVVLGSLYDPSAVPDLLAAAKKPALPVYYMQGQPSPNTQLNGIYDALRKIGSGEGAEQIRATWADAKGDAVQRGLAVDTYAFVVRGDAGVADLGKIAADNKAEDSLRQSAATSFARLATNEKDIDVLLELAAKYEKAANEARAKADAKKPAYDKAKAALDEAKQKLAAAKNQFQKEGGVKKAKAETINAMTTAQKAVDDADEPYDNARAEYKPLDNAAKDYRSFERMFETHVARVEIYLHCRGADDGGACYAKALDAKPDDVAKRVAKWVRSLSGAGENKWTDDDKKGLVSAEIERAMLELGKMGHKAEGQTGALLDKAKSEDRLIRESVLLALPKIAKLPCADCETKLDAAIKAGAGKSELAALNVETVVLRNYFTWAGKK